MRMPDERSFALRQADQMRTDLAAIEAEPEIFKLNSRDYRPAGNWRKPRCSRRLTAAAMVLIGIEAFERHCL